mmetsp:Transcript_18120/g.26385  ORF Transcript_18120/g.26385 Transcript_18120/m.26385 type:complete len:145 (-) Transcript_18120:392-826(-)|eukprot:CAMPEP_0113934388 /NCGR_PEP_ID=MMETSP1339-20121228/1721_1 /TAXON_ID=94617 /ORGANISM="Fibrocapsa japonica" /LENGTH=144 /DNA_ID=CAMNT_0000936179 /DNA_START=112 /DNA_END=546 /DNA_ORIENTATION=+ /assembly_acc=CAM_ASM_000762
MAQVAQIEMTQAQKDAMRALASESYTQWASVVTEEGRAKTLGLCNKYTGEQTMARLNADFAASDADGNGRLNQAEFLVFHEKQDDFKRAEGTFTENLPNVHERLYALCNEITGAEEGISMPEYLFCIGTFLGMFREIQAAAESA